MKDDQATCFLWYKSVARRGTNEIASCVCRAILNLPEEIKHVILYSHSRMECDGDHAVIEKAKKSSMQISHPHDWAQLIRMAGKKKPFNVIELAQEDFCDYASLLRTDIQMRKSNEDEEKFVWQQVRWLRYVLDKPTKVLYKTPLKEEVPISGGKKNDFLSLLPYIPPVFHEFYKNLKTEMDLTDPICDSDEEN
ncbi:hypothetical protein PR048_002661 [Dryococelus australis]|uniref:Uncharacterized protein n=1 Tax=Dryococelus australis TaxID=614101 RepID=A0ABQ9IKU1_9NEOP|nr:hypothetical protein PR048_002661 [Dryococelus australis]